MGRYATRARVLVGVVLLAAAENAGAQATRTWVSGVGDDANPCSRTAPCKTFAGAISKTAAGGEINAIDPGGFGAVTITKAITIDGTGVLAGILAAGTNGVNVNAGVNDRVVLRGLDVHGAGTGLDGIRFLAGASLHVEGSTITGFTDDGITATGPGTLFVSDTTVRGNGGDGIELAPTSGAARAVLDGVRLQANGIGLRATVGTTIAAHRTDLSGNTDAGAAVDGAAAELALSDSTASGNATGVRASTGALVRTTRVLVAGNTTTGLETQTGGQIVPFVENQVAGNPPGTGATPACDLPAGSIACPAVTGPPPVCEAPIVASRLGPCKRCKTRGGVTTCTGCAIATE